MAKKLGFILIMLLGMFSFGQTVQGYYNAGFNDMRIGPNRTTWGKANSDAMILIARYPDSVVTVLPPLRWVIKIPDDLKEEISVPLLKYNSIDAVDVTSSSVQVDVYLNTNDLSYVYLKLRAIGGEWITTAKSTSNTHLAESLKSNTVYEYMVYAADNDGNLINSDLLIFKTP